jgi:hypothetical protein
MTNEDLRTIEEFGGFVSVRGHYSGNQVFRDERGTSPIVVDGDEVATIRAGMNTLDAISPTRKSQLPEPRPDISGEPVDPGEIQERFIIPKGDVIFIQPTDIFRNHVEGVWVRPL